MADTPALALDLDALDWAGLKPVEFDALMAVAREAASLRMQLAEANARAERAAVEVYRPGETIAILSTELEVVKAERDDLAKKVYVPGLWKCAKCGFQLVQRVIRASDGAVGVRDEAGETCPNDGAPLWRVSERDAGNEMVDRFGEQVDRARQAEGERDAYRALIEKAVEALGEAGETLQWIGEARLGLSGPGDGKDRKADAEDIFGVYATLDRLAKLRADLTAAIGKGEGT